MKVAAFNVKNLGRQKVTDKIVSQYLTEIISQYSVIVILEVVDKSGKAMELLLKKLNSDADHDYKMICSSSLGRSTYKERFVCFYRADEVNLTAQYQYEDNQVGDEDAFAREPFILRFSCPSTVIKDLVLIPVHTKPDDAEKELDELYDVVQVVINKWETDNIMILGDFNADGRYLSKMKKKSIRISSDPFHWLIDKVDTTTSNCNDNTYDRIVVYGEKMLDAVIPDSAKAFNFQEKFGLTDKQAENISDHYPVEVELQTVPGAAKQKKAAVPRPRKTTTKGKTPQKGPQKRTKPSGSKNKESRAEKR